MRVKPHKPKQTPFDKWFIYKGDEVIMRNGKDKGKKGKILEVMRKQNKVVVDGINVRHSKKKSNSLII